MDEDFDIPAAEEMNDDMDLPDESPILKVGEEKEIGKQGLKKKLVKEGEGWDTPENGDEVEGTHPPITHFSTVSILFAFFFSFLLFFFTMLQLLDWFWVFVDFQFITLGLCLMELSSIPAVIGGLRSSSPLAKVCIGFCWRNLIENFNWLINWLFGFSTLWFRLFCCHLTDYDLSGSELMPQIDYEIYIWYAYFV